MSGIGPYAISKAAVLMLTKVLASEWGQFKVRVNCIAPGLVKTRFSQALWSDPSYLEETISLQPINRIGTPEDIVGAAIYLAGEGSSYMTGETYPDRWGPLDLIEVNGRSKLFFLGDVP